jgi:hypothetical protein
MEAPNWGAELSKKAHELHSQTQIKSVDFVEPVIVQDYTTHFGEYQVRDKDIIAHLYPRAGEEDVYFSGRYIDRCKACRRELPPLLHHKEMKPCDFCGKTGRIYHAGRLEQTVEGLSFPGGMETVVMNAVHHVWMGEASLDFVPELGAWAVRFKDAFSSMQGRDTSLVTRFFAKVDELLEQHSKKE